MSGRTGFRAFWSMLLLGAAGCTVGPSYRPPEVQVMNEFGEQGREPTTRMSTANASKTVSTSPQIDWWRTFHDPQLDALIERAWDANLDVQKAGERLREARAERGVATSDLFPHVTTDADYIHLHGSKNGIGSLFGGSSSGSSSGGTSGSSSSSSSSLSDVNLYQGSFDATWELDIFGGKRRAVEAADANVKAAIEDRRDVIVSVFGEVARNYIELRIAQRRLEITHNNLAAQQKTLALVREQAERGLTNQLDSNREAAQVATTAAQIPTLEISIGQSIHVLSTLIDERPTALTAELVSSKPLPTLPDEVPVGLPSDLLRRRADIRRAERKLAAATANIGVATSDLYPKLNLTAAIGQQAVEPGHLLDYGSRFYALAPMFSWSIFDAGRIRSNIKATEARQAQAMLDFKQVVLSSLKEVDDALLTYSKTQERTRLLQDAVSANERSVRIATEEYQNGVGNFIDVLDAQRELFSTQDALVSSEGQLDTSLVALYKALGGGWEVDVLRELQQPTEGDVRVTVSQSN